MNIRIAQLWFLWLAALAFGQASPSLAQGRHNSVPNFDANASASGVDPGTQILKKVDFEQKLDAQVPLNLVFRDEADRQVKLSDYYGEKPVVLVMVYYTCSQICSEVVNSTVRSLRDVKETVGKDFDVVVVSIDPREGAAIAAGEKKERVAQYGRQGSEKGWHFLTGEESSIKPLAAAVGVKYEFDKLTNQYAHPPGIIITTPQGKVARYLFGLLYEPRDVRFSLIEASHGKIGTPVEKIIMSCYHYNPGKGYTPSLMKITRLLALLTVALMVISIGGMAWREKRAQKRSSLSESNLPESNPPGTNPPSAKAGVVSHS